MAEKESARMEAFSDGVFAFAITLLVLDLKVPRLGEATAARSLLWAVWQERHAYYALVSTFVTVYVMWMTHHVMFANVRHVDGRVLTANGFLLLLISTCAFPTALLSEYLGTPAAQLAASLYSLYFLVVTAAFLVLGSAIAKSQGEGPRAFTDLELRRIRYRSWSGLFVYVVAAAAAWWQPMAAVVICVLMWAFWTWLAIARHRHGHRHEAEAV